MTPGRGSASQRRRLDAPAQDAHPRFGQLSIIIVTYNSEGCIRACLEAVSESKLELPTQTVVVDNASTDGTVAAVREFAWAKLLALPRNIGFAAGVNTGLMHASGDCYLLLNPDTVVDALAINQLIETCNVHPRAAVVAPMLFGPDGERHQSSKPVHSPARMAAYLLRSSLPEPVQRRAPLWWRRIEGTAPEVSAGNNAIPVGWVPGTCMLVRARAVEQVGLLDERYFIYFEDVDWCRRFAVSGWVIMLEPRATIVHHEGLSAATLNEGDRAGSGVWLSAYLASEHAYCVKHHGRGAALAVWSLRLLMAAAALAKWRLLRARHAGAHEKARVEDWQSVIRALCQSLASSRPWMRAVQTPPHQRLHDE